MHLEVRAQGAWGTDGGSRQKSKVLIDVLGPQSAMLGVETGEKSVMFRCPL